MIKLTLLVILALALLPLPGIIATKTAESKFNKLLIESGRCEYRANSDGDVYLVWKDTGERVEK